MCVPEVFFRRQAAPDLLCRTAAVLLELSEEIADSIPGLEETFPKRLPVLCAASPMSNVFLEAR